MTDLTKQLEEALKPSYPNDRIRFADMSYGIQRHADRLAPLHAALLKCVEALEETNEFTASILEDMEHYFENKCCPTAEEVNQCAIADSGIRYAIAQLRKALEECK